MKTIIILLQKEFRQIFRDPAILRIILIVPVVQLLLLPLAANYEVRNINLSIVDHDHSTYSRALISKVTASGYFRLQSYNPSFNQAFQSIETDRSDLILEIPAGFERNLVRENKQKLFIAVNAINGMKANLGGAYLNTIIRDYNTDIITQAQTYSGASPLPTTEAPAYSGVSNLPTANFELPTSPYSGVSPLPTANRQLPTTEAPAYSGASPLPTANSQLPTPPAPAYSGASPLPTANSQLPTPPAQSYSGASPLPIANCQLPTPPPSALTITNTNRFNPTLNYHLFMVPGILAFLVTMVGGFLCALNIVKEKEIGTIEQINVTPIKKHHFILGKLIPFWVIGLVVFTLGLLISRLVYGIVPLGSLGLLYGFVAVYLLAVLGFGLLVSTFADTQQQAMFIAFFFVMIFILMGGLFTSIDSMPPWARVIAAFNPVSYMIDVMRMIVLKGSGFVDIKWHLLKIVGFAVVLNSWAILNYRKTT